MSFSISTRIKRIEKTLHSQQMDFDVEGLTDQELCRTKRELIKRIIQSPEDEKRLLAQMDHPTLKKSFLRCKTCNLPDGACREDFKSE